MVCFGMMAGPDKDIEMLDGGEHLDEAIKKQLQPLNLGC